MTSKQKFIVYQFKNEDDDFIDMDKEDDGKIEQLRNSVKSGSKVSNSVLDTNTKEFKVWAQGYDQTVNDPTIQYHLRSQLT